MDTSNWFASDIDSIIWLLIVAFLIYAIITTHSLDVVQAFAKKKSLK